VSVLLTHLLLLLLLLLLLRMNVIATLVSVDFKVAAIASSCRESESESHSSKVD